MNLVANMVASEFYFHVLLMLLVTSRHETEQNRIMKPFSKLEFTLIMQMYLIIIYP